MDSTMGVAQGVGFKVNFANVMATIWALMGNPLTEQVFSVGKIIAKGAVAILFVAACLQRKKWKVYFNAFKKIKK